MCETYLTPGALDARNCFPSGSLGDDLLAVLKDVLSVQNLAHGFTDVS